MASLKIEDPLMSLKPKGVTLIILLVVIQILHQQDYQSKCLFDHNLANRSGRKLHLLSLLNTSESYELLCSHHLPSVRVPLQDRLSQNLTSPISTKPTKGKVYCKQD